MPLTSFMEKRVLDFICGGAAAAAPGGRWLNWATGSPDDNGDSVGPFSSRRTVTFSAANSPAGSVANSAAVSGATASAAATVRGWNLYESSVGGERLAYGTVTITLGCKSGSDNPAFPAAGLKMTIA